MQIFRINGHPDPMLDESARGYFLRIVDFNGFKNVESICLKAGTKFPSKVHAMSQQWRKLLNILTPVLYKSTPLIDSFNQHWTAKIYAKFDMKMSNLFSVNCRVCPMCIKGEQGFASADWDFALSTVCIKHKCHLIEECHHCNEPISWKRGQLDTCPACDKNYSSAPAKALEKGHPLLKLNKSYPSIDRDMVEKLVIACSRMHRPQDNMLSCPSLHIMSLDEINILLSQALGLMHSSKFRQQYKNWLEETRAQFSVISLNAVQEPYRAFAVSYGGKLNNRLAGITFLPPTDSKDIIDKKDIVKPISESATMGIKTARLKNIRDDISEINLGSQIDARRLASVIGVPFSSIQHMSDSRILKPSNVVGTIRHYLFDVNEVAILIKDVSAKKYHHDKHLISIRSLANNELLSKFALKFHHVIELILQQKLDIYIDKENEGFFDGEVCESELIKVLDERMLNNKRRLNITELAQVLNTTPQCVSKLADADIIKVKTVFEKKNSLTKPITKESLENFFAQYVSINRMSYFTGVRVDKSLRLLREQSIRPAITVGDGKAVLYLLGK